MRDSTVPSRGGLSIERKLPLLIAMLLVVVLGAALVVTYREVEGASLHAAVDRLRRVTRELASSAETSSQQYGIRLERLGRDTIIRRVVAGDSVDADQLHSVLAGLGTPVDTEPHVEFWAADGRPLHVAIDVQTGEVQDAGVIPARGDSVHFGPLFSTRTGVAYWTVAPLVAAGHRVGWIGQLRRLISTPQQEHQLSTILGNGVALYFHNATGHLWTTLGGKLVEPPSESRADDGVLTRRHDATAGGPLLADEARIQGTPWVVSLEMPVSAATAAPRAALARLALFGFLLLLVGAVAGWLISRSLTRPLVELTAAAESIARGDYDHRIDEARAGSGAEVRRLAASFNRMVGELTSARGELQRQVRESEQARHEADEANRTKSAFLATMSHELRTPLNAIAGYAELLELGIHGPVTAEQMEVLGRIRRSQRSLLSVIEDVLSFARIEAGRVEYRFSFVGVDDTLTTVDAMIAPQARAKQIAYAYQPAGPSQRVWADPDKVAQILTNLVANAVKFTDAGGRVRVWSDRSGDDVLIHVSDTGRGVPSEKLESIFEPFTQAESGLTRTAEGTGLGLAISREYARTMGGDLTVESRLGEGSTFTLRLPARKPTDLFDQRDSSTRTPSTTAS